MCLFFAVIIWGLPQPAAGADDGVGFPLISNYTTSEYALHIQNWGFDSDADGNLAVANQGGFMIYDGVRWQPYTLPNATVFAVKSGPGDRLYIGGNNELGYFYHPTNSVPRSTGLRRYKSLSPLLEAQESIGNVWSVEIYGDEVFFMAERYLFVYDGAELTRHPVPDFFFRMAATKSGILLYDQTEGFLRFQDGRFQSWQADYDFKAAGFRGYTPFGDQELICDPQQCYRYDGAALHVWETSPAQLLEDAQVSAVQELKDGTLMVATRRFGLMHFHADGRFIRQIGSDQGLVHNTVYGLHEDGWGSVWAATLNGISRVDVSVPLRQFDDRSGLDEIVRRMVPAGDEMLLLTQDNIHRMSKTGALTLLAPQSDCTRYVHIAEIPYLRCRSQLMGFDGEQLLISPEIRNLQALGRWEANEDEEALIMATQSALLLGRVQNGRLLPQTLHQLYASNELPQGINAILYDERGYVWLGTESAGVYKFDIGEEEGQPVLRQPQRYLTEARNFRNIRRVLPVALHGEVLFLTWGYGVMRYQEADARMAVVTEFGPLFEDDIQFFWAAEDKQGAVWWRAGGTYLGSLPGESGGFSTYSGVLNLVEGSQSNYLTVAADGMLWISTENGLTRFNPAQSFDDARPFTAQLHRLVKDDVVQFSGELLGMAPVFAFSNSMKRFSWSANTFMGSTEYRVKLEGFDRDWTDWGSDTQRDFTSLPEGRYRFLVEARNVFGHVAASEPLVFTVTPPWHRSWWAYMLYVAATGSVFYLGFNIRLRRVTREYKMRNQISADLHDEVSATLSSISFFAQAIESGRKPEQNQRFLSLIRDSAGDAKDKISDIVWAINPENDDWQSFMVRCRRFASDLLESRGIKGQLQIDSNYTGPLNMHTRQHIWMIFKEIITNAVRHAEAGRVDVVMRVSGGRLTLVVQDDGKGLSETEQSDGNGLKNIRKRGQKINATVSLHSEPGAGTRWKLVIPV
ncbi:sensor histidine kinase [Cyclonatronum proteinivorum]|nr:ATP-binding protein [Cyclonatronum proteinivorum]